MSVATQTLFGEFANGWAIKKLKYIATLNDEALPDSTDPERLIEYVEIADVSLTKGIEQSLEMYFDEAPSRARRLVRSGDVLVSTVRTYLKAIAAVPIANDNLVASTGFCVVRPGPEIEPRFMGWVAQSESFVSEIVSRSVGVSYPAINPSELGMLNVPVPDKDTQERIADFLDERTARIDTLIAKKQRLLELLAEKRQALITRAVTKGLNPPMKSDGWRVRRLKYVASAPLKYGANESAEFDEPGWSRFIRITDVNPDGSLRPDTFRSLPPEKAQGYELAEGDILLARSGATVGKSFFYSQSWGIACFAGYLIRLSVKPEWSSRYVWWFFQSEAYWSEIRSNLIQATIQNFSAEKYGMLQVPMPPYSAQQSIANFLNDQTARLDKTVAKVKVSIGRLQEYRAALITATVTGRMEVI